MWKGGKVSCLKKKFDCSRGKGCGEIYLFFNFFLLLKGGGGGGGGIFFFSFSFDLWKGEGRVEGRFFLKFHYGGGGGGLTNLILAKID